MKPWFRWLILPFLNILSGLPLSFLYVFSTILGFLLYHVIGYRRGIVRQNLVRSFPEKRPEEIKKIEICFYRYLADLFVETLKFFTISPGEMKKRCRIDQDSLDMIQHYQKENKNLIFVLGHLGNWEWAGPAFHLHTNYPLYLIYKPMTSKNFDAAFYNARTRLGTKAIAMSDVYRDILSRKEAVSGTAFASDQTPSNVNAYWTKFLNQDTPIFRGTARIAKKMGYPVIYARIFREKRGMYRVTFNLLIENPSKLTEDEITEIHTRRLEKDINEFPCTWLWSHRRWKHKRPAVQ